MVTRIYSATIHGIDACVVAVETDVGDGLPSFDMVGLLSSEVREARERVRTALKNSGFTIPSKRITINLAPANLRKTGTFFDLPIAISILAGIHIISRDALKDCMFAGELSLNGQAVRVNGILPIVLKAKEEGMKRCFIPRENLHECRIVKGIDVIGVENLNSLVTMLITGSYEVDEYCSDMSENLYFQEYDFCDVKGQKVARRAAEIAVAGKHNMLMIGSPGAGKTMIAKCIPTIMPEMTEDEKLEVAKIKSVAGLLEDENFNVRPFRSPHHTTTVSSIAGGGVHPMPGELTLAHHGVLFLDELPEFSRQVIEILRQPLEDRYISISRIGGKYKFPADFILLAASNPCKCGYYPDRNKCKCTEHDVRKYMEKISGPIMDRIDLCINIEPVKYDDINDTSKSESSESIRKRVIAAVEIQRERYKNTGIQYNGALTGNMMEDFCRLGRKERKVMENAFHKFSLSVRSYYKVIKVARTISDLEQESDIQVKHLAEALAYRTM